MEYIIGIDLGGTTAKAGIFTKTGVLQHKWEIPTDISDAGKNIIPNLVAGIRSMMGQRGIAESDLLGIGFTVPGAVVRHSFVAPCVNLNNWGGFEVSSVFSNLINKPVVLINDANAAAMGEFWQGGAKDYQNMIFITLGTGVGGGVVINGQLLEGPHGCAGEIGHIHVKDGEQRTCGCGRHGCLEQYCSATGIVAVTKQNMARCSTPSSLRALPEVSCKAIFDAAKAGDAFATEQVDLFADTLGQALASVACVCDTDVYVLGGGVSKAGSIITEKVKAAYERYCFPALHGVAIRLAELGNDAGMYGAAKMVIDQL